MYKIWNNFLLMFLHVLHLCCRRIVYLLIKIKVYLGTLLSLALYSTVCCQNLVTKSLTTFRREKVFLSSPLIYSPIHPACHLSDIWFHLETVEVLIIQIADYTDCGMSVVISNYVRSILNIPRNN